MKRAPHGHNVLVLIALASLIPVACTPSGARDSGEVGAASLPHRRSGRTIIELRPTRAVQPPPHPSAPPASRGARALPPPPPPPPRGPRSPAPLTAPSTTRHAPRPGTANFHVAPHLTTP